MCTINKLIISPVEKKALAQQTKFVLSVEMDLKFINGPKTKKIQMIKQ